MKILQAFSIAAAAQQKTVVVSAIYFQKMFWLRCMCIEPASMGDRYDLVASAVNHQHRHLTDCR